MISITLELIVFEKKFKLFLTLLFFLLCLLPRLVKERSRITLLALKKPQLNTSYSLGKSYVYKGFVAVFRMACSA